MSENENMIENGATCSCGKALPWHLLALGIDGFEHICTCGLAWLPCDGGAIHKAASVGQLMFAAAIAAKR